MVLTDTVSQFFFQNDKHVYLIAEVPVTKYDKLEAVTTVLAVMGMHPS